jgi:hypothetical protein
MMEKEMEPETQLVAQWFSEGVAQPPKGNNWQMWRDAAEQSAQRTRSEQRASER